MKHYITYIIIIYCSLITNLISQSISSEALSFSGAPYSSGSGIGGSTLGEVSIGTYNLSNNKILVGFQYIEPSGASSNYPSCLNVTTSLPSGVGSLRNAFSCSMNGDVITFDSSIPSSFIFLDQPTIISDKNLTLINTQSQILKNLDPNNIGNLIEISGNLIIQGLNLEGTSEDAMIIKLISPGSLEVIGAEISKIDIQN